MLKNKLNFTHQKCLFLVQSLMFFYLFYTYGFDPENSNLVTFFKNKFYQLKKECWYFFILYMTLIQKYAQPLIADIIPSRLSSIFKLHEFFHQYFKFIFSPVRAISMNYHLPRIFDSNKFKVKNILNRKFYCIYSRSLT